MLRRTAATAAVLGIVLLVCGAKDPALTHRLEDEWADPAKRPAPLQRVLVIGITDEIDTRKQFENKFVSHLRGFGIDAVTSYSLVPDLTAIEDETEIVQAIAERQIDGAISVRVVPLAGTDTSEWGVTWRRGAEADGDLRDLIDESLPVARKQSKHWGVEAALWRTDDWDHVWAARTNAYTRKTLRKGAGAFVERVIDALRAGDMLVRPVRDE